MTRYVLNAPRFSAVFPTASTSHKTYRFLTSPLGLDVDDTAPEASTADEQDPRRVTM